MNAESPGNRIRARRVQHGITAAKLASLVGLTERAVNRIEVGIIPIRLIADYLPQIAAELGTTVEIILDGELQSERATREELQIMRKEGIIQSDAELEKLCEFATETIRKRNNANIPLNREELLILIEVIRGADGY